MEWGLFVPITYLTSYALLHGIPSQFAFLLLSLMNIGAIFGRCIPGYCADRIGRFNTFIITVFGCLLCTACLWIPANASKPVITLFALLFGFTSGSNVSLAPVCIGQLCKLEAYGRGYATAYAVVSISCLTGIPIAGQILTQSQGQYLGLIAFAVTSYAANLICLIATKLYCCGWRNPKPVF
ncbi:Riboflavin transporter MCH5 [Penicillium subrubescens]|uniref:Riboflavin transporter MCH5 n=1 Tax=Penicillium subrubescens TaxID=1316194 RepID=A0A1Q5UQR2_9EURO|nr:Riboflavin transporter MCH5 [Penicillium subrubescens]